MFSVLWKIGLQFLPWTHYFSTSTTTAPATCVTSSCGSRFFFDTYTVPEGFYTDTTYADAQPTETQRGEWRTLVQRLLTVDNANCGITPPSTLVDIYAICSFQEYCVLYETTLNSRGTYNKGWGSMIVPSLRFHVARRIHISAPHPGADFGTVEQAAAIFQRTGSNSLLVTGRHRNAFIHAFRPTV